MNAIPQMSEFGTERFNVKIHYHIIIMNIISRSSESIRIGDPGEILGYHSSLDIFYDILSAINEKVRSDKELEKTRKRLWKMSKQVYLVNNKELRIDYYQKLCEYRSKLLDYYKYTGLVPPRASDYISGHGEIDKIDRNDLMKEEELDIDKFIDKRGIKLTDLEIKSIDEFDKNLGDIEIEDDDLNDGL